VELVQRRVERVIRAGRPLVRPGCLTRGITSYYFLRRKGLNVELCFGLAQQREDGPVGHCWLTLEDGRHLESEDPARAFVEIARLSSRGVTAAGMAA